MRFEYKQSCQVPDFDIYKTTKYLEDYAAHLREVNASRKYEYPESVINLPFDEDNIKDILETKRKYVNSNLKYIILAGIGGSELGAKAIYDSLYGYYDTIQPERFPKMIFLDTINPSFRNKLIEFIEKNIKHPEEILINAVSKSGKTMETQDNLDFLTGKLPYLNKRLVLTTQPDTSFWKKCEEDNLKCLKIHEVISGRFSFFSPVGLFPLACSDIDVLKLTESAMRETFKAIRAGGEHNEAMQNAAVNYELYRTGKRTHIYFVFHPELESLGKWQVQLTAESLGKEKIQGAHTVGEGIMPIVSVGTNDLHSLEQLYLSGPRDKFITFIYTEQLKNNRALHAVLEGVKQSHLKRKLPFAEIILKDKSPQSLSEYMQSKMIETMYMAKLMGVNAFDQPNVEEYKKETKRIMARDY